MAKAISTSITHRSAFDAAKPSNLLRRALLTSSAVIAAAALATGTASPVRAAPVGPDAVLIGLCAELDALEHRIHALFDPKMPSLSFEDADATVIEADHDRVLARICALTPATDEGSKAVVGR